MNRRRLAVLSATIIALLLVLSGTGCSPTTVTTDGRTDDVQSVEVTILIRGAVPEVSASFEPGQEVRVRDTATLVGVIDQVVVGPALTPVPTAQGDLNAAESPVLDDVRLIVRGEAVVGEAGYRFGGRYLYVNDDIKYLTPYTIFNAIITSVEVVGD